MQITLRNFPFLVVKVLRCAIKCTVFKVLLSPLFIRNMKSPLIILNYLISSKNTKIKVSKIVFYFITFHMRSLTLSYTLKWYTYLWTPKTSWWQKRTLQPILNGLGPAKDVSLLPVINFSQNEIDIFSP